MQPRLEYTKDAQQAGETSVRLNLVAVWRDAKDNRMNIITRQPGGDYTPGQGG